MKLILAILLISVSALGEYIAQTDSTSCVPVAIYNALQTKNIKADLDEIKKEAQVGPTGTSFKNFLHTAEKFNLKLTLLNEERIDSSGTYLIAIYVYDELNPENRVGHMVYVHKGVVYNLFSGVVETYFNYIVIQGLLYQHGPFPIIWRVE